MIQLKLSQREEIRWELLALITTYIYRITCNLLKMSSVTVFAGLIRIN